MVPGRVFLVGAGPGDPDLLTLRGKACLESCDVVVYDRLANACLLDLAPTAALRIYVGKEPGGPSTRQEAIHTLLIDHARQGRQVVRLKGGDPFVFGRGGEEAAALVEAGIPWEYVPGVTSAVAAPGAAGIPVTHRGLSTSFSVITAHSDPYEIPSRINWDALAAGSETLVLLMGVERLARVARRLMEAGRPPSTPTAVVSHGTLPEQRSWVGTLETIAELAGEATAPATVVVGPVAALGDVLGGHGPRPLLGWRVAVTRPAEQSHSLHLALRSLGAIPLSAPTIQIRPIVLTGAEMKELQETDWDWILFTSANAVRHLVDGLRAHGNDLRALGRGKVAALGPETALAAERAGFHVDFTPTEAVAEALVAEFPEAVDGKKILFPRARAARPLIPERWTNEGATVRVLPVYETVPATTELTAIRSEFEQGHVDAVLFSSASTVRELREFVPAAALAGCCVACIGPVTAEAARSHGLQVDVVAVEHTAPGLVEALCAFATSPQGRKQRERNA